MQTQLSTYPICLYVKFTKQSLTFVRSHLIALKKINTNTAHMHILLIKIFWCRSTEFTTEGNKKRNDIMTVDVSESQTQKSTKFKNSNLGSSLQDQFEMNMFYIFIKNACFHYNYLPNQSGNSATNSNICLSLRPEFGSQSTPRPNRFE